MLEVQIQAVELAERTTTTPKETAQRVVQEL
jgi:hypothetical protein